MLLSSKHALLSPDKQNVNLDISSTKPRYYMYYHCLSKLIKCLVVGSAGACLLPAGPESISMAFSNTHSQTKHVSLCVITTALGDDCWIITLYNKEFKIRVVIFYIYIQNITALLLLLLYVKYVYYMSNIRTCMYI